MIFLPHASGTPVYSFWLPHPWVGRWSLHVTVPSPGHFFRLLKNDAITSPFPSQTRSRKHPLLPIQQPLRSIAVPRLTKAELTNPNPTGCGRSFPLFGPTPVADDATMWTDCGDVTSRWLFARVVSNEHASTAYQTWGYPASVWYNMYVLYLPRPDDPMGRFSDVRRSVAFEARSTASDTRSS